MPEFEKKINYNRLQKLRNVILKTLFKVEPPLLYVYCHFFIYIQFQLLNVYLLTNDFVVMQDMKQKLMRFDEKK